MNKRLLAPVILLIAGLILASSCHEAPEEPVREPIILDGFEVILSEPKVEFPDSITFDIEAESNTNISKLTLQYQVDKPLSLFPVTSVAFLQFEPASEVKTRWEWDMTKTGGLPPGAEIGYWWVIEDAEGDKVKIPEDTVYTLEFSDDRYSWDSLSEGKVRLLWYRGSDSFARQLMTVAQEALNRLAADTGAELENEAAIYIYASSEDLRGALVYPQEWTGGVAFTEYGTIAIGISPNNLDWGRGAMAHELAHLVVHQITFNGYGLTLPTWLDEGLAVYAEGELNHAMESILKEAIVDDNLLSVQILSSPFSADPDKAYLSYAQSYSLVEYLIGKPGGKADMSELLNAFRQGSGYMEALHQVYGLSVDELDAQWREYAAEKYLTTG